MRRGRFRSSCCEIRCMTTREVRAGVKDWSRAELRMHGEVARVLSRITPLGGVGWAAAAIRDVSGRLSRNYQLSGAEIINSACRLAGGQIGGAFQHRPATATAQDVRAEAVAQQLGGHTFTTRRRTRASFAACRRDAAIWATNRALILREPADRGTLWPRQATTCQPCTSSLQIMRCCSSSWA
jgi:hypothetical protein